MRLAALPAKSPLTIVGGLQCSSSAWNPWCCVAFPSSATVRPSICASVPAWRSIICGPRRSAIPCATRYPTIDRILPDRPTGSNTRHPARWKSPRSEGPVGPTVPASNVVSFPRHHSERSPPVYLPAVEANAPGWGRPGNYQPAGRVRRRHGGREVGEARAARVSERRTLVKPISPAKTAVPR